MTRRWFWPHDGQGSRSWQYDRKCAARCGGHTCTLDRHHEQQHRSAVGFAWTLRT